MRPPSIWKTLGISRSQDRTEIRRAYAKKLKVTNPEDNPEGFKVLRAAYEQALDYADNRYVVYELTDKAPQEAIVAADQLTDLAVPALPEPEASSPAIVDEVAGAYFAALNQLERHLQTRSSADDDERRATLNAILSSPMLDNIEIRDGAELWLAQLMARTQPRSDALIPRLVERFGWNNRRINRHQAYAVKQVLQRETDLEFLRVIRRGNDVDTDTWHILSRPPEAPSLWRRFWPKASRSDIQNFLRRVRNEHPTVIDDLNEDSMRMWEERTQIRDLFDQIRIWSLVLAPIGIFAMLCAWLNWGLHPGLLAPLAAIPVVAVGGAVAYEYGYYRLRKLWEDSWHLQQNGFLAFGWGPTLLVTLALAAAPPSLALTCLIVFLSVAVVWWTAVTGEPNKSQHSWPWQIRLVVAELFLVAWWVCALWDVPVAAAVQMTPAVLAASLVSGFGRMPLFHKWLGFGPWLQRATLCALIAGVIGAVALLWQSYAVTDWKAPAFACAAVMVVLHRVPTLAIAHWTAVLSYAVAYGALFVARTQGGEMMSLAFAGSVLLFWAGLNCALALYNSWRKPAGG